MTPSSSIYSPIEYVFDSSETRVSVYFPIQAVYIQSEETGVERQIQPADDFQQVVSNSEIARMSAGMGALEGVDIQGDLYVALLQSETMTEGPFQEASSIQILIYLREQVK